MRTDHIPDPKTEFVNLAFAVVSPVGVVEVDFRLESPVIVLPFVKKKLDFKRRVLPLHIKPGFVLQVRRTWRKSINDGAGEAPV
jgi:hypothetical protein